MKQVWTQEYPDDRWVLREIKELCDNQGADDNGIDYLDPDALPPERINFIDPMGPALDLEDAMREAEFKENVRDANDCERAYKKRLKRESIGHDE